MKQQLPTQHVIIVTLALLLLATTPVSTDDEVLAQYAQQIQAPEAQLILGDRHLQLQDVFADNLDVYTQDINLFLGTTRYRLTASDTQNIQAVHEEPLLTTSELQLRITNPSPLGASRTAQYDLEIQTGEHATCQWRFWTPNNHMRWQAITTSPETLHAIEDFGSTYRFEKEELIPIEIKCANEETPEETLRVPLGWSEDTNLQTTWEYQAQPAINREQELLIQATSPAISACELKRISPEQTTQSTATKDHLYRIQATNTRYELRCTDARGEQQQEQEISVPYNPEASLQATLQSPRLVASEDYQLVIRTNQPATCVRGEELLGALEQGHLHQQRITLDPRANDLTITCSTDEHTQELTPTIRVDRGEPTLNVQALRTCDDDLVADISTDEEVTHLLIQANDEARTSYVRTWTGAGREARYHQPGMGAATELTITAYKESGLATTTTTSVQGSAGANCAVREEQDLTLINPPNGASEEETFELILASEYPSTCQAQINEDIYSLEADEQGHLHTHEDFQEQLTPGATDILFTCSGPTGASTTEQKTLYWMLPDVELTVTANPEIITDPEKPHTNITATANQPVQCRFDEGTYSQDYRTTHTRQATIGRGERTLNVTCRNAHENTATQQITFTENLPSEMRLQVQAPNITNDPAVDFALTTTTRSLCTASAQGNIIDLEATSGQRAHETTIEFEEGRHDIQFTCVEQGIPHHKEQTAIHELLVDTTPPTLNMSNSQLTCGLNTYSVLGKATDNFGVQRVEITFAGNEYTTNKLPHRLEGLNLASGEDYTLQVTAYDQAGNPSTTYEDTITAHNRTSGACDEVPPETDILPETLEGGAVNITVFCEDDQACAQTFTFGTGAPTGACTEEEYEFPESDDQTFLRSNPITITETSRICWEVSDVAGNTAEGSRVLNVTGEEPNDTNRCEQAVMCSNNEVSEACGQTDVDCGGFACGNKCEAGLSCETNSDCASGVCTDGTCAEPTCSDGVRNGEETDVDCGGPECQACEQGKRCNDDSDCQGALICSYGSCMEEGNNRDYDAEEQEPVPIEEGVNWLGILLILFGSISIIGGGGYIYYEKEQEQHTPATTSGQNTLETPASRRTSSQQQPRPNTDFKDSALREEARKQRASKRKSAREDLISEFEDDANSSENKEKPTSKEPKKPVADKPKQKTTPSSSKKKPNKETEQALNDLKELADE